MVMSQVAQPFLLIFHTCPGKASGVRAQRQAISVVTKPNWILCRKFMSLAWKQDCFSEAKLSCGGGGTSYHHRVLRYPALD